MAQNPNYLLVEDHDTQGAVIGLMRHYIPWPQIEDDGWPAKIEIRNSGEEVLDKHFVSLKLKDSEVRALGLIVDADTNFTSRWDALKEICRHLGASHPKSFPQSGLILDVNSKRFGVWIMPDNRSRGMIENFCHALVPDTS